MGILYNILSGKYTGSGHNASNVAFSFLINTSIQK